MRLRHILLEGRDEAATHAKVVGRIAEDPVLVEVHMPECGFLLSWLCQELLCLLLSLNRPIVNELAKFRGD